MTMESRWMRLFQILWPIAAGGYLLLVIVGLPVHLGFSDIPIPRDAGVLLNPMTRIFSLIAVLISFGLAVLLYWRGRTEPMALFFSYFLLLYGLILGGPAETLSVIVTGSIDASQLAIGLVIVPLTALLVLFPSGRPEPRFARWLIVGSAAMLPLILVAAIDETALERYRFSAVTTLGLSPTFMALLVPFWRYRFRATPIERQQMKWGLYGVGLFLAGMALLTALASRIDFNRPPGEPWLWWEPLVAVFWYIDINVIPIFFALAILRARLWDIDLIIRRTLMYSVLTAILGGLYFGGITGLQALFANVVGANSTLAVVISTLAIAALFQPIRIRVQRFIDRRFYRQNYDATRVLNDFADAVRDEIDVEDVEAALLRAVDQTIQPKSVSLWLRATGETEVK